MQFDVVKTVFIFLNHKQRYRPESAGSWILEKVTKTQLKFQHPKSQKFPSKGSLITEL